ncbi:Oidioi.mRNA.OKI2018_I69.PAR.g8717.t1.cds [Oikopleura dioica]|uniref:Oidioi.mRNA.OKI2018_I69.PAR.g8717.t1.cds n=1 Tax=Oikopleura dioica TaxID=34765 RepID=A0ABN7RHA5_OIKDI|nr:Oidioi.mRNA.OKI2018_I69.PAR.g8717.t1.cds [Oikopleura dioica]
MFESHGFGTTKQMINFVIYGSIFWIMTMVLANFVNYERTKFRPGVGSYCIREFKTCIQNFEYNSCLNPLYNCASLSHDDYGSFHFPEKMAELNFPASDEKEIFTDEENELNRNLCFQTAGLSRNLCENLCFESQFSFIEDEKFIEAMNKPPEEYHWQVDEKSATYNHSKNFECMEICKYAAGIQERDDCPQEKRCPNGCPCKGYKCTKNHPRDDIVYIEKYHKGNRIDFPADKGFYKMMPSNIRFEKIESPAFILGLEKCSKREQTKV